MWVERLVLERLVDALLIVNIFNRCVGMGDYREWCGACGVWAWVWKHVFEGLDVLFIANILNRCVIRLRELAGASDSWPMLGCAPLPN